MLKGHSRSSSEAYSPETNCPDLFLGRGHTAFRLGQKQAVLRDSCLKGRLAILRRRREAIAPVGVEVGFLVHLLSPPLLLLLLLLQLYECIYVSSIKIGLWHHSWFRLSSRTRGTSAPAGPPIVRYSSSTVIFTKIPQCSATESKGRTNKNSFRAFRSTTSPRTRSCSR